MCKNRYIILNNKQLRVSQQTLSTDGNSYSFQACTNTTGPYTDDRTTNVTISAILKPTVTVVPTSALLVNTWDATTQTLTLKLGHTLGAANVVVACPSLATGTDPIKKSKVTVYGENSFIRVNGACGAVINVYDTSGKLLKSVTANSGQFEIAVSRGIYVVAVNDLRKSVVVE